MSHLVSDEANTFSSDTELVAESQDWRGDVFQLKTRRNGLTGIRGIGTAGTVLVEARRVEAPGEVTADVDDSEARRGTTTMPPKHCVAVQAVSDRSVWTLLRRPLFRALWIASLTSSIGTWMHELGAAWLMTSLTLSPVMVALMQTAASLPIVLLALPAGAIADMVDRRRMLLFTQGWMLASATALGVLTVLRATTPWLLLILTFALGAGAAMNAPAWQVTTSEAVPRAELPAAVTLTGLGLNLARPVGPAVYTYAELAKALAPFKPRLAAQTGGIAFERMVRELAAAFGENYVDKDLKTLIDDLRTDRAINDLTNGQWHKARRVRNKAIHGKGEPSYNELHSLLKLLN